MTPFEAFDAFETDPGRERLASPKMNPNRSKVLSNTVRTPFEHSYSFSLSS
jgi:hypothetical protein